MEVTTSFAQATQVALEKAGSETAKPASGTGDFSQLLAERMEQHGQMTQEILQAFGMSPQAASAPKAISAAGLSIPTSAIQASQEIRTQGKTLELLTDVNRSALQMDGIVDLMSSGRHFSPQELLALQAGMHQIVLEVELAGKMVEQGASSFKQINNTQV